MLKKFKKKLRKDSTDAENILWYFLRNRHLEGVKFRRQHILQGYIVDFVCLEKKLIIEIDGSQHDEQKKYDDERALKLKSDGFKVIRFWNNEILENINEVLEVIYGELNTPHPTPAASTSPTRGEVPKKSPGFSLIEVLISLLILSLFLLGADAMENTALREAKCAYLYSIAMQQLDVIANRLSQESEENLEEILALWNQQNSQALPQGRGIVSGHYPDYLLMIIWGNFSEGNCDQNHPGLSGCARLSIHLPV